MEKIIADLVRARRLQSVILWYLAIYVLLALIGRLVPFDNRTVLIVAFVWWAGLAVFALAIFTHIFSSGAFVRMGKEHSSLQNLARVANVITLAAGGYFLIHLVWGSRITELARQTDNNLGVIAEFSSVAVGLILLATHVFVVRFSLAKLKSNPIASSAI